MTPPLPLIQKPHEIPFIPHDALNHPRPPTAYPASRSTIQNGCAPNAYPFDSFAQINGQTPVISVKDFEGVRYMSMGRDLDPRVLMQKRLLDEKKALHKKSLDKAQYWGNTIMGKRKARLAAQDQKGEDLEAERIKVDKAWSIIMAAETKSQIERARNMQNYQKENVRKLHSDFGLMRTLKERDLQLVIKKRQQDQLKLIDKHYENEALQIQRKAELQEWNDMLKKKADNLKFSKEHQEQIISNLARKEAERKADESYEKKKLEEYIQESKRLEIKDAKPDYNTYFLRNVAEQLEYKKNAEKESKKEEAIMDKNNQDFLKMKHDIENRIKAVKKEAVLQKQNLSEHVGKIQEKLSKEYQDKMTEFLAKHSRPISKGDSKEYKDNLRREQVLKEIEEFRLAKKKELETTTKQEIISFQNLAKQIREDALVFQLSQTQALAQQRQAAMKTQEYNIEKRKVDLKTKAKHEEEEKQFYQSVKNANEKEDEEFVSYANNLANEWEQGQGYDTNRFGSILVKYNKNMMKKQEQVEHGVDDSSVQKNTYERLGFL